MARWLDPPSPPVFDEPSFCYCQCSCEDFTWRQEHLYDYDAFAVRAEKAKMVHVARKTDLLLLPDMEGESDEQWCAWRDDLDALRFLTITRDKVNRSHQVTVTLEAGEPTTWPCKHILAVTRWVAAHRWSASQVHVCWRGDPRVEKAVAWAKYQGGGEIDVHHLRLSNDVFVVAWGLDEGISPSPLFRQKGAGDE